MQITMPNPFYPDNPVVTPVSIPTPVMPGDIPRPPLPGGPGTSRPCVNTPDAQGVTAEYPWLYPPVDAQDFRQQNAIASPAVNVNTEVFGFQVPLGWDGIIRRIQMCFIGAGFEPGSGDIVWRLVIDSRPVNYYGAVISQIGTPSAPDPLDFGIIIRSGSRVSFQVEISNGLLVPNTRVLCGACGWYWKVSRANYSPGY